MSDTCSLFPPFGDLRPSCLLPSQGQGSGFHCAFTNTTSAACAISVSLLLPTWPPLGSEGWIPWSWMMMRILTLLLGIILRGDGEKYITAFRLGLPHSPGKSPLTMQRESLRSNQCSWSWLPALTPLWSGNHSLVRVEVWILCLLVGVMPQLSYSLSGGSSYFIKKKKDLFLSAYLSSGSAAKDCRLLQCFSFVCNC